MLWRVVDCDLRRFESLAVAVASGVAIDKDFFAGDRGFVRCPCPKVCAQSSRQIGAARRSRAALSTSSRLFLLRVGSSRYCSWRRRGQSKFGCIGRTIAYLLAPHDPMQEIPTKRRGPGRDPGAWSTNFEARVLRTCSCLQSGKPERCPGPNYSSAAVARLRRRAKPLRIRSRTC